MAICRLGFSFSLQRLFHQSNFLTLQFHLDKKQAKKSNVDYEKLNAAGIWLLKPEYIADYLTVSPKPPVFNYVLDEAKALSEHNTSIPTPGKRKADDTMNTRQKRTRR